MKAKEIQDLLDFIDKSGLEEVNIETENFKLATKRTPGLSPVQMVSAPQQVLAQQVSAPIQQAPQQTSAAAIAAPVAATVSEPVSDKLYTFKSPMIGTFYNSSSPENPPFASIGDSVSKGQTLCIIEAMKLFNEIESEVSGRIVKVLVGNATPVEFDQPLFVIELN
jgi:acetyl-CoA carboxylase biotin carboxyl carrier protein